MATTMKDGLEDLTVATLKERLRSLGQPVSGRKQDLIDRLRSVESEPDVPSSSLEISLEPPSSTSPSNPVAEKEPNLEPVLDAEILVAELIDTEEPPTTANEVTRSLETDPIPLPNSPEPVPATAKRLEPATLGEQFRDPKFLAALALTCFSSEQVGGGHSRTSILSPQNRSDMEIRWNSPYEAANCSQPMNG